MAKKKSRVVLPGGMAGLAHKAQNGGEENTGMGMNADNGATAVVSEPVQPMVDASIEDDYQHAGGAATDPFTYGAVKPQGAANDTKDRTAPAAKKLPKAEGKDLARQYTMAKDSGEDSWSLFLDLAKNYKERDSKLATVYIDSDLKSVLDRLKSANSIKMPSTAILSAIVARFVFDHEQDIKNAIFGESLL